MKAKCWGGRGPSAETENKVQEKGRGRERCGEEPTPGKPHLWKRVCLCQGRAPGQTHRPNNSLLFLSEERSPELWEGRASHSQGCGQLCQGHFPWHRGHTGKAAMLKSQKVGQPSPPQLCQEALSCHGHPGSHCAKIPLLPHTFPEISVLGNESGCSGEPEHPMVLKPPQAGTSHHTGSQPRKRGPEMEGGKTAGLSGPSRLPGLRFLSALFIQRVLSSGMELVVRVNSTKSWPLPSRSSRF